MSTLEVVLTSSVIATLVSALVSVVIGWLRDRNLAQFKDDLRNEAFKRETKFVNLHEKRAEMIADIYRLLAIAQDNVERAILPLPVTPDKRGDSAFKAFWELKQSFNQNRIFFSSSQCTKLDELLKLIGVRWLTAHQYRKEVECVIRAIPSTDSDEIRPLIPAQTVHRFRNKSSTDSSIFRPLWLGRSESKVSIYG